ncbi:ATP-grasp domain-containing protein [Serratia microhaemolytica]|uniref:ATP-grasp domain-containing protein n=1 Tax=Serratia microhaemolytica TaxID=2675110 RepID=UPI000FDE5C14|nr:ATP-grasp domain-containing protein [Serratia microhaemolytica]
MKKDKVIIVDPFSTGALLAPELSKKGLTCYSVLSSPHIPSRFTDSYISADFVDKQLYSPDEIKKQLNTEQVVAVIPGAETGVYCADLLAAHYQVAANNHLTTDWRRQKGAMQNRLAQLGLNSIASKKISQFDSNLDQLDSQTGYVIKPNNSCLTDGVFFFENKPQVTEWISQIDWQQTNIVGEQNQFYLVQEKLEGEEFVVDLVVNQHDIKVCSLCKYRKGLHNNSHFVYECLDVLDISDQRYHAIILTIPSYERGMARLLRYDLRY